MPQPGEISPPPAPELVGESGGAVRCPGQVIAKQVASAVFGDMRYRFIVLHNCELDASGTVGLRCDRALCCDIR